MQALTHLDTRQFNTLVFAGGGNRCWWQAGLVTQWLERGFKLPAQLVGTSAGAGVAAALLTPDGPRRALEACVELYGRESSIFDWRGLARLRFRFGHEQIYPAWVAAFVNEHNFADVRASASRLSVAVTHQARVLGLFGSVIAGTVAYLIDKHVSHSIHPRLPRWLGLRQHFKTLQDCASVGDAQALLTAAAAAPPLMPAVQLDGRAAIDGGYTDNAPIPQQTDAEKAATLVLLTRHYPGLPRMFRWRGRAYLQPSAPVPVSTLDCTRRATVREAFAFGAADALALEAVISH